MSGSVFLNNLDDFIVPSQACVNPLVAPKLNQDAQTAGSSETAAQGVSVHVRANSKKHGRVTLANDFSSSDLLDFSVPAVPAVLSALPPVQPDLIKGRKTGGNTQKTVATVSLNDCLACSGCVTSAESILIQEQSNDRLLKLLDERDPHTVVVVQISPNSRASIADFLEMSAGELFVRVAAMLKSLGVRYVLDAAAGNDVALVESREEFLHRLQNGRSKEWTKPETTIAQSSSSVQVVDSGAVVDVPVVAVASHLPLLVSHCPGWVCYAEKTSPQAIPYMSTVKSAQQIVGTIVKNLIFSSVEMRHADGNRTNNNDRRAGTGMQVDGERDEDEHALAQALQQLSVEDLDLDKHTGRCSHTHTESNADEATVKKVIVVSIQPCFDKKLEASRKDFYHSDNGVNEVDLVLSTTELWQIIELYAFRWANNGELDTERNVSSSVRAPMDFDDPSAVSGKKLRRNEDREENDLATTDMDIDDGDEDPRRFLLRKRSSSLRAQSFQNVLAFLHSFTPDASEGEDEIERLFRCVSHTGEEILSAAERNAGSGGYSEFLFKSCAERLYGLSLWAETLQYVAGRNPDYAELDIAQYVSPEQAAQAQAPVKLKFARAYGFRNIQSLLMKMKRGAADVDLVEISACPSGCNNGGGQLRALSSMVSLANSSGSPPRSETSGESKERVGRVEALFHGQLRVRRPEESPLVRFLYHETRLGAPLSEAARRVLHTRYHAVPKLEAIAPLAAKW